jgi:hypothetical protein
MMVYFIALALIISPEKGEEMMMKPENRFTFGQ